jgi:hypothetical protein
MGLFKSKLWKYVSIKGLIKEGRARCMYRRGQDGTNVGTSLGRRLGADVGISVGEFVGAGVGDSVGAYLRVGARWGG